MSAVSPSPAPPSQTPSSNSTQPPSSSTTPPAQQPSSNTTQPPSSTTSPPPQQPSSPAPNSSVSPPPATSPPPPTRLAPPPTVPSAPPPFQLALPPTVPSVPPPSQLAPPPSQSPPLSPPVASPPTSPSRPPPPPPSSPARRSPPPQSSVPPRSSPPLSPPPPSAPPPSDPAPPLPSPPQENSPPPAAVPPPRNSTSTPPQALPPVAVSPPPPPRNSTSTPPRASPPVAVSPPPPPRNSTSSPPRASPPPPRNSTSTPPPASPPVAVSPPPPSPPPPSSLTPPPTNSPPSPTTPSSQPVPPSNSTPSLQLPPPPLPRSLLSPPPPSQNGSENSGPRSNSNGGIGTGAIVAIAVCGGILLLGFIGIALWCLKRHKKRNPPNDGYIMPLTLPSSTESDSSSLKKLSSAPLIKNNSGSDVVYRPSDTDTGGLSHSRNWFSYEELIKATNGFSPQNILGEGGFGFVYKGCLLDGREVAVKQLKIGGGQGEKEFKAEVDIISRVHHRHLVSLVGYCIQDNKRLLVYDYVPNNTLHFHLHGEDRPVLEWANRVKIAAGAARGIAYLHEDCNPRIIHRDIKPSNILLDYSYEAMVADFGLAKLALDANSHITTRVMGTFGYVAPEYASSGKLTEKSDVYSYGVVLLELITGRKPIDESQSSGDESLVEWARPLLSHAIETKEFESLVDPKLEKNYLESEMLCMIQVAASCVRHSASKRPRMGQVVRAFDSLAGSDLMNGMRVGESQALNSAQQAENRWFRRAAFGSFSTDFFSEESLHT